MFTYIKAQDEIANNIGQCSSMSRMVRNKNEENRPGGSGGDRCTVKRYILIDKRTLRTKYMSGEYLE